MKRFVFLILLALFSCDDDMDPLKAKLINTTWTVEKMELIDFDNVVIRTEYQDPDNTKDDQKVCFKTDEYMSVYTERRSGCGQWTVDKGKIHFVISHGQIIPGYCSTSGFSSIFVVNNNIEIANDTLIIEGVDSAFDQFYYLSDWMEIWKQVAYNKIKMKVYYRKANSGTQPELVCCGRFDWI